MGNSAQVIGGGLFQWDVGRRLVFADPFPKQAHFAHVGDERAVVVEVSGDGTCDIPNLLLQESRDIAVWASDGRSTLSVCILKVRSRARPDTYVYAPTDILTFEDMKDWVLEQIQRSIGSYRSLDDKPSISGHVLEGDSSLAEIGVEAMNGDEIRNLFEE